MAISFELIGPEVVRGLQENAARAFPAEHVAHVGGWWLRHSSSNAWWAGTVLPHAGAEPDEMAARVDEVEAFYAGHGAAAGFQITPTACPATLNSHLARRGYRHEGPMSLQVAPTDWVLERVPQSSVRIRLNDEPTEEWFEVWYGAHGGGDRRGQWDSFARVERESAYASVIFGTGVAAVGRVVVDNGWAGVFGMATLPHARGKGAGRGVLTALADWASAHSAEKMYLQVECDNTRAISLYEGSGFTEVCQYHYRIAERTSAPVLRESGLDPR